MYKLCFPFLLAAFLFAGNSLKAQSDEFLSQLKKIIAIGEKGEMSTIKGELEKSTIDRAEQHRVYSCLLPLTGFDINFSEKDTCFMLSIVSQRPDAARLNIDALLNNEIRERSGINGYTTHRENASATSNVLLQKTGSPVTVDIFRAYSNTIILFSIKVMKPVAPGVVKTNPPPVVKKTAPPVPVKTPITKTPLFLQQLKTILEATNKGMGANKGKLVHTTEDGTKNYTCNLKLEGFKTYIIDDGDVLAFHAEAGDWKLSAVNAKKFLDKKQREEAGITGYSTTFTLLGPSSIQNADEVTNFDKKDNYLFINVYKNCFGRGYRIEIEEIHME